MTVRRFGGIAAGAVLFGLLVGAPLPSAANETHRGAILAAYRSDRAVAREIDRLRARHFEAQRPRLLSLSTSCGYAGCNERVLIVQTFEARRGRSEAIVAVATIDARGRVLDADLVDVDRHR